MLSRLVNLLAKNNASQLVMVQNLDFTMHLQKQIIIY